jgi:hypothetical protein
MVPQSSSKALITTYQTTLFHNPEDHNISKVTETIFNKIHMKILKRGYTLVSENIFVKFLSVFNSCTWTNRKDIKERKVHTHVYVYVHGM